MLPKLMYQYMKMTAESGDDVFVPIDTLQITIDTLIN